MVEIGVSATKAPRWDITVYLKLYLQLSAPLWLSVFNCSHSWMSSALEKYESFLVNNVGFISSLESTLRSVTWILPGRFKDAELASEACEFMLYIHF